MVVEEHIIEKNMKRVAFAGGGSGGHCYPLLSISKKLQEKNSDLEVYFITRKDSVESTILGKHGYSRYYVFSGKLNTNSILEKIFTILKLPIAMLQSLFILIKKRPDFVMSSGSNAGASFLFMAFLLRVPCFIYEQNKNPGIANKWMGKFCKKIFLNFLSSKKFFINRDTEIVGMVVREEIKKLREYPSPAKEGIFSILVFGGSQGSIAVNRIFLESLKYIENIFPYISITHQSGEKNYKDLLQSYESISRVSVKVLSYIDNMAQAYRGAHLVVCRAGASTLAELAAAKKASVLLPMPSRDKHQIYNAEELRDRGMAKVVHEGEAASYELACIIRELHSDRSKLQEMEKKIVSLDEANVEEKIISSIKKYLTN